jgi:iron complex outermembrane recepter protein
MGRSIAKAVAAGIASLSASGVYAQTETEQTPMQTSIDEVVVTARRREESAQTVPVSVTALSAAALEQRSVQQLEDLTFVAPGLRFSNEGGRGNMSVSLRGLSQLPVGEGVPAVVTYFADVPLIGEGLNLPTYDLQSVQVLKGPQGTLFGRNTIGGAVVITPQAPSYNWEGYATVGAGNYSYREGEGALNIPISEGVAAVRVAGQIRERDSRTSNLSGGSSFDDMDQRSARISLLLEPTDGITNTLIFDYFKGDEKPGGLVYIDYKPGVFAATLGPGLAAQGVPAQQVAAITAAYEASLAAQFERQRAAGPYRVLSDLDKDLTGKGGELDRELRGLTNTTRLEFGNITVRNIFGYREHSISQKINTAAIDNIEGPLGPFTLFHASSTTEKKYLSDEFQVLGETDRLNWIVGAFYGKDKSTDPMGSLFQAFDLLADGPTLNYSTAHIENESYAAFAQLGYKLTDDLTLNVGARYSWDDVTACGAAGSRYFSASECEELAALNQPEGAGIVENDGSAPTWTLGLDYKITDQLFGYITTRRGYRGANVNTPAFETAFTAGGVAPGLCLTPGGVCPDFRPYQTVDEEKVTDYEVGLKSDWSAGDTQGRTNVSVFHTQYKDAIQFFNVIGTGTFVQAPDLPNRQSLGVNAADFSITGVELELAVSPIDSLTVSLNGTYIDQKVDKLNVPPIGGLALTKDQVTLPTPEFSGSAAVRYVLPLPTELGEFALNADYFYTGKWDGQFGVALPSYDLMNARLEWNDIVSTGVDAAFWVRNLLDEEYATAASVLLPTFPTSSAYFGDPRMYGVQLSYHFGN